MAARYDVFLSNWIKHPYNTLGIDGNAMIEDEDRNFYYEYREILQEVKCLLSPLTIRSPGKTQTFQPGASAL